jgi:hypothetical protein
VLHVPSDWTAQRAITAGVDREWAITVPASALPTRPLGRLNRQFARYELEESERTGAVFPSPDVTASLMFTSGGLLLALDRPVVSRAAGAAPAQPVAVLPLFSVEAGPERLMIPRTGPAAGTVEVRVRSNASGPRAAVCRLRLPYGWAVQPTAATLQFTKEDESHSVRFRVVPPRLPERHAPCAPIQASATAEGRRYTEGFEEIRYPHVATRFRPHPAEVCAYTLDAQVPPGVQVGYVAGVGDGMPEALTQLGVVTTTLTADDLARGDLSRFTTIITGVRAYQTRPDLKENQARLFDYVRGGGNLVLQYNRPTEWAADLAPIPAQIGTRRITDEDSLVQFLLPHHPLLNAPNKLGPDDFKGWVQDRAVYLLDASDERYEELLASSDPWPLNPGQQKGLLVSARVGNGRWTYIGLALWRQLQAGVPGAYRILANLVGQPRGSGRGERGAP